MVVVKEEHIDFYNADDEVETRNSPWDNTSISSVMVDNFLDPFNSDLENPEEPLSTSSALPEKSLPRYQSAFAKFEKWCAEHQTTTIDEQVLLAYFEERSAESKASTLWTLYAMMSKMLRNKFKIDITKYASLVAFLKRKGKDYTPKLSRTFTKEEVTKFLAEADEKGFLLMKVVLIIGLFGACKAEELVNLQVQDIKDESSFIEVSIKTDSKRSRDFVITPGNLPGVNLVEIVQKYLSLRPAHTKHHRLFIQYLNGKCTIQPIGKNAFGPMPRKIAEFLQLPNPEEFTGHSLRRSSEVLLADQWRHLPF